MWLLAAVLFVPDSAFLVKDPASDRAATYVAVVADAFAEDCDRLLAHRAKAGQTVALVRVSDVARAFGEGKISVESVAAFVRHAAARWGTRFVLLVGDAAGAEGTTVPTRLVPSAYYSAKFAGEEHLATDHVYSEAGVFVGRFPADTRADVAQMIEKTIAYEAAAAPGPWQRRVSFITGEAGFGTFLDSIIEAQFTKVITEGIPAEYEVELAYAKATSPYCPYPARFHDNALRLLNEGSLFYVYVGHGQRTGCDQLIWREKTYPVLDESHVPKVRVQQGSPVMVVLACSTGEFDYARSDCLGEALIKSPGGPVAFLGGSRITQPYGNALLGRALVQSAFESAATLGEIVFAAKRRVLEADGGEFRVKADAVAGAIQGPAALEPMRRDVVMHYNVLGDPALALRRSPNGVKLEAPETVRAGQKLVVRGEAPLLRGRALVSLDRPRDEFVTPPFRIRSSDPEIEARFWERYRAANDKSIARAEVAIADGRFEAEFALPENAAAGACFLRVFAWDGASAALGARALAIQKAAAGR